MFRESSELDLNQVQTFLNASVMTGFCLPKPVDVIFGIIACVSVWFMTGLEMPDFFLQ